MSYRPERGWGFNGQPDAVPGRVFRGQARQLIDVVSQGQLQPTGELLDPEGRSGSGRTLTEIEITDDLSAYDLPGGAVAQISIYSEHWHELALLRKILL